MRISDEEARRVESQYLESTFVQEICVFTLDEIEGERRPELYAVVVPNLELLRRKRIANIGDLLRFEMEGQSSHLPPDRRVEAYDIWFEPLIRTNTDDIDRAAVRRRALHRRLAKTTLRADPIAHDANLEIDLGLDSIDRIALFVELERRLGVRVPQARAHEILTAGQLIEAFGLTDAGICTSPLSDPWPSLLREAPEGDAEPDVSRVLKNGGGGAAMLWTAARLARLILPRMLVTGRQHLPHRGPYILCPNHQSYLDPFFVISTLPYRLVRQMFAVGAAEYFETPLTTWVARQCKLVPVDPDASLVGAMRAVARGLGQGKILILFPEGERTIDGRVKRFKKGAAILSQQLDVPVVPVAIRGVFDIWPRSRPFNWRSVVPWAQHHVQIAFGEPMRFSANTTTVEATALLQQRVQELFERLTRATAPARRQ